MLGVDVTTQVDPALERAGARVARERPQSGVLATVCDEVRRLAERLAALTTHVRLLTFTRQTTTNSQLIQPRRFNSTLLKITRHVVQNISTFYQ